jgi:hypothetical protein
VLWHGAASARSSACWPAPGPNPVLSQPAIPRAPVQRLVGGALALPPGRRVAGDVHWHLLRTSRSAPHDIVSAARIPRSKACQARQSGRAHAVLRSAC